MLVLSLLIVCQNPQGGVPDHRLSRGTIQCFQKEGQKPQRPLAIVEYDLERRFSLLTLLKISIYDSFLCKELEIVQSQYCNLIIDHRSRTFTLVDAPSLALVLDPYDLPPFLTLPTQESSFEEALSRIVSYPFFDANVPEVAAEQQLTAWRRMDRDPDHLNSSVPPYYRYCSIFGGTPEPIRVGDCLLPDSVLRLPLKPQQKCVSLWFVSPKLMDDDSLENQLRQLTEFRRSLTATLESCIGIIEKSADAADVRTFFVLPDTLASPIVLTHALGEASELYYDDHNLLRNYLGLPLAGKCVAIQSVRGVIKRIEVAPEWADVPQLVDTLLVTAAGRKLQD